MDVAGGEFHLDAAEVALTATEFDVHVGQLGRKLGDDPGSARYVRTIRSVGYRMGEGM